MIPAENWSWPVSADLVPLDLLTCEFAQTELTLPVLGPWLAIDQAAGVRGREVLYRQMAEVYGRGYHLSQSYRQICN